MHIFQRQLLLPGATDDLPRVLSFMEEACEGARVDPDLYADLQLAVEEACCNVIEHAYGGAGGPFSVHFERRGRDVHIAVRDCGRPFDPSAVTPPDMRIPLEDRPIGGLGLHLIHQLMDEVHFSFSDEGNMLVMVKRGAVRTSRARDRSERCAACPEFPVAGER